MQLDMASCGSTSIETVVNGPIQTNTYFVFSGDACVIVDPAWDGERLADHLRNVHPTAQVAAIVSTHGHADHVGGAAGLRRALGESVPFVLPARDVECAQANIAWQRSNFDVDTPEPPQPDRLVKEGDTIDFGSARLQTIETPGHTPGGVVYFLMTDNGPVAFVGDTLFPGGHGRTDLDGGDDQAIIASLSKLAKLLPQETLCLCGHGPSTTMERELRVNPFIV